MYHETTQSESLIGTEDSNENLFNESQVVEKVFSNGLLFEKILELLIFNKDPKASRKMIQTLRIVQKRWLATISNLLNNNPLRLIVLNTDEAIFMENDVQLLNQFMETFTSPQRLDDSLLPMKLILCFNVNNYQTLLSLLSLLGNELMELHVVFPKDGGTMPLEIPQLTFPLLRKMSFLFSDDGNDDNYFRGSWENEGRLLLDQILNASEKLQHFVFPEHNFPEEFEKLKLPASVVCVEIQDDLRKEYLEILLNNQLLKVQHLILKLSMTHSDDLILFKILDRFRHSLVNLQLNGHPNLFYDKIIFPKLEKLKKLVIDAENYELDPGNSFELEKLLPNVKSMSLNPQSEAALSNWVRNSTFNLVESLSLSVVKEHEETGRRTGNIVQSISLDTLVQVKAAFPQVTNLEIAVNIKDMSGLVYLFQNMSQLKSLRINIGPQVCEALKWKYEAILVGLPEWLISAHAESSVYFQSFISKRGRKPSLLNLSELTSFTLYVNTSSEEYAGQRRSQSEVAYMFSDLLFSQAFFNMPNLRTLILSKVVQPTEKMKQQWIGKGCHFEDIVE